ncbi:G patch domain-containing protein 1 [Marchantia polymorpha subsp. ruderalis]
MDDGEEGQYVHYGQALEREEDLSRKKAKLAVDQGQARRLPPWKQEVTDAEGRRRFHGAFTGGYSAGYYNTVGSKEGWAPKTFTSSRNQRAQRTQQSIDDFLDEDELEETKAKGLGTSAEYDTFGFTAAEVARRNAEKEVGRRPSAIPGPVPDEIVIPATQSIGVKLLMKMGWRRGRVVGPRHFTAVSAARREGRKATIALASSSKSDQQSKKVYGAQLPPSFEASGDLIAEGQDEDEEDMDLSEKIPDFVFHPKADVYGLGFDPLKNAPEFKELKLTRKNKDDRIWMPGRVKDSGDAFSRARNMGSQFGVSAMDLFRDDDEEIYDTVLDVEEKDADVIEATKPQLRLISNNDCIPGFQPASSASIQLKPARIPQPVVPMNFDTKATFATSLDVERRLSRPEPPEAPPPADTVTRKLIDGLATFVARIGPRFEALSREKHFGNPQFSFLDTGPDHEYYSRKLWEEQRVISEKGNEPIEPKRGGHNEKLGADQRALILGETPLPKEEKARLPEALAGSFTSPATKAVDSNKMKLFFKEDLQKQARFEKYLAEKLVGGIKRRSGEGINMSKAQHEQEIYEFDKALQSLEAAGATQSSSLIPKEVTELTAMMNSRFTSGTVETMLLVPDSESEISNRIIGLPVDECPRREENSWRPASMLCKRFNLADPFAGKPAPVTKPRSQTDFFVTSLISSEEGTKPDGSSAVSLASSYSASGADAISKGHVEDMEPVKMITERPVDLYKAIFSDDDDDEDDENETATELPTPLIDGRDLGDEKVIAKQSEAAQAALNRLAAGDFLESLGKELGLRVPVEKPRVELPMKQGSNRHGSNHGSGVAGKSEARVPSVPHTGTSWSGAPLKNYMNATDIEIVEKVDQRDKVSRWAPIGDDSGRVHLRLNELTSTDKGPPDSTASMRVNKNVEAEPVSHKRTKASSRSSGSTSDSDSEFEDEKSKRDSKRSRTHDSHSDGDSDRKKSKRRSRKSRTDSDRGSDSDKRRSRRHSKKSRRKTEEKEPKRHHKSRHEKHGRKEDEKDASKKRRRHKDKQKTSPEY